MPDMEFVTRYDPAAGYEAPMLVPIDHRNLVEVPMWTEEQIQEACMMAEIPEAVFESILLHLKTK